MGVACPSPEVGRKSHAPRKADCGHVSAAETSLKFFLLLVAILVGKLHLFALPVTTVQLLLGRSCPGLRVGLQSVVQTFLPAVSCVGFLKGVGST